MEVNGTNITPGAAKAVEEIKHSLRVFVITTAILYVIAVALSVLIFFILIQIQDARRESCQKTYEGIREVFTPFLAPPAERTKEQQADIDLFNKTIDEKKSNCGKQTKTNTPVALKIPFRE
jgi:hypothetical protein